MNEDIVIVCGISLRTILSNAILETWYSIIGPFIYTVCYHKVLFLVKRLTS